jgi:hypothetical protein
VIVQGAVPVNAKEMFFVAPEQTVPPPETVAVGIAITVINAVLVLVLFDFPFEAFKETV